MAKKRSLRAVSDSTPIESTEAQQALAEFNLYIEDELETLLDAESDAEFGGDYRLVEKKAKLSTWSAQDFSNIYLRYRPHLERHARRFLPNQTQIDEVVQDAFLYLMVTLPDLDSELGVLRFLKWKVRLICLDVMRASGRAHLNSIEDHPEIMADDPEISAGLEQADDAAIVKLALSKLNPRHREVLIASLYEEKSNEEIAAQVGLSENATRQLIFRARAAFKKALLGDDIDTDGMSVAAILSVAARRAAEEAKKVGAQAMVFVLFLALAIGGFVTFNSRQGATQQVADDATSNIPVVTPDSDDSAIDNSDESDDTNKPPAVTPSTRPSASASASSEAAPEASATIDDEAVIKLANTTPLVSNFYRTANNPILGQFITVGEGTSLKATFRFVTGGEPVQDVKLTFKVGTRFYSASANKLDSDLAVDNDGNYRITTLARYSVLTDAAGNRYDDLYLETQAASLKLIFDADLDLVSATLDLVTI